MILDLFNLYHLCSIFTNVNRYLVLEFGFIFFSRNVPLIICVDISTISDIFIAMHPMSMSFGGEQQEVVATDGDFITNNDLIISDFDQVRFSMFLVMRF